MSDPRREQTLEKLIEAEFRRQAKNITADHAGQGAVSIVIPGLTTVTLSREEAINFSHEVIRAIAAGEPTWEGFD